MRNVKNLSICVLVLALVGTAAGTTLYVPSGSYPTIQAAIGAAASSGDEIEVAPGTYTEAINFNGKAVRLYSSGGPEATTIDGGGAYHVVQCVSGEGPGTILEGFNITGGNANGTSYPDDRGGGMLNTDSSSPIVTNCLFSNNLANRGGGMQNNSSSPTVTNCTFSNNSSAIHGGGMYNSTSSSPNVTNCTFSNNSSVTNGGGMYNNQSNPTLTDCTFTSNTGGYGGGMHNSGSSPTVTNCTFSGNAANDDGGGMFNYNSSSPTVADCTFSSNLATGGIGGGMYNLNGSSPALTDCMFTSNWAATNGGGMDSRVGSNPTVSNCTFSDNWASEGGGMFNYQSSPTVSNCTFSSNGATGGIGGGMYNLNSSSPTVTNCMFSSNWAATNGGGMDSRVGSNPSVTNCTFNANTASVDGGGMYNWSSSPNVMNCIFSSNGSNWGAGLYNYGSHPLVTNCTFSGNSASDSGGGMLNQNGSSPTLTNCTFSGNTCSLNGGGMCNYGNSAPTVTNCILWGDSPDEIRVSASPSTVTYSDVQGGYAGTGNIADDPLFADTDGRLSSSSPCIDAGDDSVVAVTTDLDGNPRIQGLYVDMGAFEMGPETMLVQLKAYILQQVALGNIDLEMEVSLLAKVNAAISALNRGNANDAKVAMNNMNALINQVEAQTGKKITSDAAAEIIVRANAIVAALGG